MSAAVVVRGLEKRYGSNHALRGLDLTVPEGAVCGLIGPNGAGKTTTFGVLGGYVLPSAGTVDLFGQGPFEPARHGGTVTLVPQDSELSSSSTVKQLLVHYGRLQGLAFAVAEREAQRVLAEVALTARAGSRLGELSHGMKRRVAVAQALLGRPRLILLDEPTSGLDPALALQMRTLIATQRGERTVIVSSHNLRELETLCDYFVFLREGRAVRSGSRAEILRSRARATYELVERVEVAEQSGHLHFFRGTTLVVEGPEDVTPAALNARYLPLLLAAGAHILDVRVGDSLEAVYGEIYGGGRAAPTLSVPSAQEIGSSGGEDRIRTGV